MSAIAPRKRSKNETAGFPELSLESVTSPKIGNDRAADRTHIAGQNQVPGIQPRFSAGVPCRTNPTRALLRSDTNDRVLYLVGVTLLCAVSWQPRWIFKSINTRFCKDISNQRPRQRAEWQSKFTTSAFSLVGASRRS